MQIFAILFLILLNSCGFEPVYSTNSEHYSYADSLRYIEILGDTKVKLDNDMQNAILDSFRPRNNPGEYQYKLKFKIKSSNVAYAIEQNNQITRYLKTLELEYSLYKNGQEKTIDSGIISVNGSYDSTNSHFATIMSERNVEKSLIKIIASELKRKIIFKFENKCDSPSQI